LPPRGAPNEGAIARVEFIDTVRGFDHLGPGHRQASHVAHHDPVGAAGDDAHAAEAAVGAADQHDDWNACGAHVEQRAHHLRYGDQACIRLVQAHAARFGEQQHGIGPVAQCAPQQAHQLGAMHFADPATHELTLLGSDEHGAARQRRAADRDAVVERRRHAQLGEVRAGQTFRGRKPLVEACRIDDPRQPFASRAFGVGNDGRHVESSEMAWSRRRLTTAGVAPMSLTDTRRPASGWR
jgi:hypothetical protein